MTAPRHPRHRLPDSLDIPAPAGPVEPPTRALPTVPAQRSAAPQVVPARPPAAPDGAGAGAGVPLPEPGRGPAPARRGALPALLAGLTALVLALGVVVVVVESGDPADATAPVSGR